MSAFPSTPNVFERWNNNKPAMVCSWVDDDLKHTKFFTCEDDHSEDFVVKRMRVAMKCEEWYQTNVVMVAAADDEEDGDE